MDHKELEERSVHKVYKAQLEPEVQSAQEERLVLRDHKVQ